MDTNSLRNLTFLMSLGGLSLGCPAKEETTTDATDSNATDSNATDSNAPTMGGTTDGASETDTGMSDTTNTEPTTSSTTEGTTGGAEPDYPLCKQYAEHYVECVPEAAGEFEYIFMYCSKYWAKGEEDGPACLAALEELETCLIDLDCKEFNEAVIRCEAETNVAYEACPSGLGSET